MTDPKDYVIWGSGGHAKVLSEMIRLRGGTVIALFDNKNVAPVLPDVPLHIGLTGFHDWLRKQGTPRDVAGLVAIGGGHGRDRLLIQTRFREAGLLVPAISHPSAVVSSTAFLGAGSQVLALANVAADVRLGESCIINHKASVDHECDLGHGVHVAPGATLCGCVRVSDNVFIGAGAVVLPRVTLGMDSVIGAGAVVTRDVSPGVVVVGIPARTI